MAKAKKIAPVWEQSLLVPITIISKLKNTEARFVTVQAAYAPFGGNRRDYTGVIKLSIERPYRYGRNRTPAEVQAENETAYQKLSVAALILMEYGYGVELFETSHRTIEAHVFQYEDAAEKAARLARESEAARVAAMVTPQEKMARIYEASARAKEQQYETHQALLALRRKLFEAANGAASLELYLCRSTAFSIADAEAQMRDLTHEIARITGIHDGLMRKAQDHMNILRNRFDSHAAAHALEVKDEVPA